MIQSGFNDDEKPEESNQNNEEEDSNDQENIDEEKENENVNEIEDNIIIDKSENISRNKNKNLNAARSDSDFQINTIKKFISSDIIDLDLSSSFYNSRVLDVEQLKNILSKDANNGKTGMKNLGNSCYISTVIQSLSHSLDLTYFFLSNLFNKEINYSNNSNVKRGLSKIYIYFNMKSYLNRTWSNIEHHPQNFSIIMDGL
jgi:ubiquitin C-terminal hydrolase